MPLKQKAAMRFMDEGKAAANYSISGEERLQEKEVIKEGLSEYFIYTVEGTETIANGWSKRIRSFEGRGVPLKIQYRYRPREYGDQLVRMYLMTNDEKSNLGTTPLPDGTVRVFRSNGRDGLSYLTQQAIKYVPIGDKIELNLGQDPEVIFELIKSRSFRDKISMLIHGPNTFQQVGDPTMKVEANSTVAGWDDHSVYRQRIRNYTTKPIDVEIRRNYDGHVVFRSQLEPKMHDFQTVELSYPGRSGRQKGPGLRSLQHQGHNAKQMNVTLEIGRRQTLTWLALAKRDAYFCASRWTVAAARIVAATLNTCPDSSSCHCVSQLSNARRMRLPRDHLFSSESRRLFSTFGDIRLRRSGRTGGLHAPRSC